MLTLLVIAVSLVGAGVWVYRDIRSENRGYRLVRDSLRFCVVALAFWLFAGYVELLWWVYQRLGGVVAAIAFFAPLGWLLQKWCDFAGSAPRVLRGTRIAAATSKNDQRPERLYVGDVEIPVAAESTSFLAIASPGAGKTQTIIRMLDSVLRRGDVVICVDPGGESMCSHYRDGDTIFNPIDRRSVSWSPFAEMEYSWDAPTLAASIVGGTDGDGEKADWNSKAVQLVAAVMQRLWETGQATNKDFLYYLTIASNDELEPLVAGLPAQGLFARGADRALGSVRFITSARLAGYAYLDPQAGKDAFSFRRWFSGARRTGGAALWMPWRKDQRQMLGPMYGTVIDLIAAHTISGGPDRTARMAWLVADELPALGRVDSLLGILAEGRKFHFAAVAGAQAPSQIEEIYGRNGFKTAMTCFQTVLILRTKEAEAAEYLSKVIGEHEIEEDKVSTSTSTGGEGSTSRSVRTERRQVRAVLPSELRDLPDRVGYLMVAGDNTVYQVGIPIFEVEPHTPAFVPRDAYPTGAEPQAPAIAEAPARRPRPNRPAAVPLKDVE